MKRFNYYTEEGKRTSISLTETDMKALKFIIKKDFIGGTDVQRYIKEKTPLSKVRINSFSAFISECILLDVLNLAEGGQNERK